MKLELTICCKTLAKWSVNSISGGVLSSILRILLKIVFPCGFVKKCFIFPMATSDWSALSK